MRNPRRHEAEQGMVGSLLLALAAPILAVIGLVLLVGSAFAQAPVAPAAAADVDVTAALKAMIEGVQNGNWWLAAAPALTLVVFLLRKYDLKIPKFGPAIDAFLNQPLVAFLLPVALSAATGLFGALATGMPAVPAFLAAMKVAGLAIATYVGAKKAGEQFSPAPAQAAGATAAKDPGPTLSA